MCAKFRSTSASRRRLRPDHSRARGVDFVHFTHSVKSASLMACDRVKAAAEGEQFLSGSVHDGRAYVEVTFRIGATSLLRARSRVRGAPLAQSALSEQRYAPALQQCADWPVSRWRRSMSSGIAGSEARFGQISAGQSLAQRSYCSSRCAYDPDGDVRLGSRDR
jgi:hypothetical protein